MLTQNRLLDQVDMAYGPQAIISHLSCGATGRQQSVGFIPKVLIIDS